MQSIIIRARNNLDVPIRLTLTNSGYGDNHQILIAVGHDGTSLKGYYNICVDTDLLPDKEWREIGLLNMDTKTSVNFTGKTEGEK